MEGRKTRNGRHNGSSENRVAAKVLRNPSIWAGKLFGADQFRKASGCAGNSTMRGPRLSTWRLFLWEIENSTPKNEKDPPAIGNRAPVS